MSGIVVNDLNAWIVQDVVVFFLEIPGDHLGYQRLDLTNYDPLNSWMEDERTCGHSCAETHHENRLRIWMHQCGKVSQHSLQPHIAGGAGRFDLSADMKVAHAARPFRHCDGRAQTFACVAHRRRILSPHCKFTSVCDEQPR